MSTIAELTIPADEFALAETLESTSDITVEIERVVAYDPDEVLPYVWFGGDEADLDQLESAMDTDESVDGATLLTDLGDERLYRMGWVDDVAVMVHMLTEERATILQAAAQDGRWQLRILFPERERLASTYEFASDKGLTVTIDKIHELEGDRQGRYGLTDAQHETLVAALDRGYYQIPRRVDMEALADELDISHQALSERLRRAHRTLVEEAITVGTQEGGENSV